MIPHVYLYGLLNFSRNDLRIRNGLDFTSSGKHISAIVCPILLLRPNLKWLQELWPTFISVWHAQWLNDDICTVALPSAIWLALSSTGNIILDTNTSFVRDVPPLIVTQLTQSTFKRYRTSLTILPNTLELYYVCFDVSFLFLSSNVDISKAFMTFFSIWILKLVQRYDGHTSSSTGTNISHTNPKFCMFFSNILSVR